MNKTNSNNRILGWREWGVLPDLAIPAIKMKVDTGAKTSALHAFHIDRIRKNRQDWVRFALRPLQRNHKKVITCETQILDERVVTDSGGHKESRYVICSSLQLSTGLQWDIELTLTDRDNMRFRMLLGRQALQAQDFLVNPTLSYCLGKPNIKTLYATAGVHSQTPDDKDRS
ncbi:MAG: hypothetical protein sometimes fused to ribosomal protein S6 glutaminyl transferase [uncultured Thiotrichaceae bacterium]|uniref:Retropepsin-like aspartic endopeptidase domain-containing protein n=1 Tax=uncultured Thiotrichaceae bacterium TaxID=298394 RepID=A0A6S6U7K5_9GAMM|nr:MAG: hypothetical protein sometimes fused to ribosomal protein S6 glutaminyl transferase [uncultured Thiotrichaceae bacterium]